jgi:MFS family permease
MRDLIGRIGPVKAFREIRRDFDRVVLVLAAGDLVASFGFSLVFPFLTIYLVAVFHATAFQAGLVISGYSVCSIFSGAAGGWLADRVGRKTVMVVSVGVTGAVIMLMGQAHDLFQIALLTVVLGLIDPAFVPAARAAVADVVDEARRPRAYGLLGVAAAVGWIAGPAIGAGLSGLGYPLLFSIAGLLVAMYAVVAIRWLPETRPIPTPPSRDRAGVATVAPGGADRAQLYGGSDEPYPPMVDVRPTQDSAGAASPGARPLEAISRPPGAAARPPADPRLVFAAFLPIAAVLHMAAFQWVTTMPIYAASALGISTQTWGILFSINGIIIVVFQLRVSTASERRSKPRLMAVSALIYASAYALVALIGSPGTAVIALSGMILLTTVGEMLLFPIEPSFVSELSPVDRRGRYQGIMLAAAGVGSAIGPPLGGWLIDAVPGPLVWWITAASLIGAAGALVALARFADRLPRTTPGR